MAAVLLSRSVLLPSSRYIGICSQHRITLTSSHSARKDTFHDGFCKHWLLRKVKCYYGYAQRCKYSTTSSSGVGHVEPVFVRAGQFTDRLALIDQNGQHSYGELLKRSEYLAKQIRQRCNSNDENGHDSDSNRVAFLCDNDVSYVVTKWAIWMSGGIAVPLCKSHPVSQMGYFIEDSQSSLVLTSSGYESALRPVAEELGSDFRVVTHDEATGSVDRRDIEKARSDVIDSSGTTEFEGKPALIIYTSGTTGKPKGVVLSHGNLYAMITGMVEAWEWTRDDVILHALPLHHVHGIVNVLMTSLHCGATCVMLPKFNPQEVWKTLLTPLDERSGHSINLFMAVPTMYALLAEEFRKNPEFETSEQKKRVRDRCLDKVRLMVSGSAALPQPIMEAWREITGHALLERYGMTEIGMCLTNPLHGDRVPGAVGNPFPRVQVRIARENVAVEHGYDVIAEGDCHRTIETPGLAGEPGELMVKGPNVFQEYWNKPAETTTAFTSDGWFKTGDTVLYRDGVYRIVGRTSVDVIKSGAYKISALEIERHLLAHPDIRDAAVVGLPDPTWGQTIAAILVVRVGSRPITQASLSEWCRDKMPPYHVPRVVKLLEAMPRNVMGKVNKKELIAQVFPEFK